jgi:hypothetical protein
MDSYNIQGQQEILCLMAVWGSTVEARLPSDPNSCPRLSKYIIKLDEIKFDDTKFELNNPLSVNLFMEDGLWNCEFEAAKIISLGQTAAQAVHSFSEDFCVLWDEIAQCSDDALSNEAQALKRCLLSIVKSVKKR